VKKRYGMFIMVLCLGLIFNGCAKKVVKEQPGVQTAEEAARLEAERAAKERAEKEATEKELAKIREDEARKASAQGEASSASKEASKEFEQSLVAKKQPGIEGEVYESSLLKDIHFDFDRYEVRPEDAEILKQNAAMLQKSPKAKVQIEGHCDERGTNEYNLALGERRATSTKSYLVSLGISPDRISTITYGEEKPLDPGRNEGAWAKNRRAHIVLLSK
jgi:peptidoglycan-associated lipoprotein